MQIFFDLYYVLMAKSFNNQQYFVIKCRCVGFTCLAKFLFYSSERKTKLGTFNINLKLNSCVLLNWMKNGIPSHLFLDIWLQELSYIAVRIIKWLINYYFCQSLKKSEISISISSTTNEIVFTKENNFP